MGKKIDPTKVADLDEKTRNIFHAKGYIIGTMVGAGSYGEVYKGTRRKTDTVCAVKVMNLELMNKRFKKKFLPRELASLMEIKHEYIVRVFDIFRSNNRIYVFMEFAANGELGSYLKKYGCLSEDRAHTWLNQCANALNYLHEQMFTAHRDIKIDNILLSQSWVAKLTDFGFAKEAIDSEGFTVLSDTFCGTRPYYSPQIVLRTPYSPFKADIYALGVVLYAMMHNRFPFHFKDNKQMAQEQLDLDYRVGRLNRSLSKELKELVLAMFEPDEEKRVTCAEVIQHPWIQLRLTE